jgi:hypothetical protein
MLTVTYDEWSVTNKPLKLSVIMLNVIMLSAVAPFQMVLKYFYLQNEPT